MSVTIAQLTTYAQDLVCDGGDETALTTFATDLYEDELPANDFGARLLLSIVTAGTAATTVTTTLRKLYAVFLGGTELVQESLASLSAQGAAWPDHVGQPVAYTNHLEADRTIRLYPTPAVTSSSTANVDTETDYLVLLGTCTMGTIPDYLRLPAALWLLAREYERETDHRDQALAKIARTMAEKFFGLAEGV